MNITDCYDIDGILRELETALQIDMSDYEEQDVDKVITTIKKRIGRQYQLDLTTEPIDSTVHEIGIYKNAASLFVDIVANLHAKLCGYCHILRYTVKSKISLHSINFLGYDPDLVRAMLRALREKKTQPRAKEAIDTIKTKMGSISICREKRLIMIMILSYELGFNELAAACAEVLFIAAL